MKWNKDLPKVVGVYWFRSEGEAKKRVVNVWKYNNSEDNRLFTHEDGGAPVTDIMYHSGEWAGPLIEPVEHNKSEMSLEDELKEMDKISHSMGYQKANNYIRCSLKQVWIKGVNYA